MAVAQTFYLNVVVLNKDDVVKAKVQEKVGAGYFGLLGKLATSAATHAVSDDKFAQTVASKLVETIPSKVQDLGITLELTTVFQRGTYVVLRAKIAAIDTPVLLAKTKGDDFATKFAQLLELLDFFQVTDAREGVETKIRGKVHEALLTKLEELLPAKLQESGNIAVSVTAKREVEQAEFFFAFLNSLEKSDKA